MNQRRLIISAFVSGFVFGLGLIIAGMVQPQKIIAFLSFTKSWDPSLMFVMAGAIPVHFLTYRWIAKRPHPIFDLRWHYPTNTIIDRKLVIGSAIFGIGWGLGGICPGPALAALASGSVVIWTFFAAMIAGMLVFKLIQRMNL